MKAKTKALLCNVLGMALCVVPPVIATLEHFPIWIARGGETIISGLTVTILILCAIPFKRQICEYLRSPSAWFLWLCIFIFSSLFSRIITDVAAISLIAFPANFAGALLFRLRDKYKSIENG